MTLNHYNAFVQESFSSSVERTQRKWLGLSNTVQPFPETEECLSSMSPLQVSSPPHPTILSFFFFLLPLVSSFLFGHHLWRVNASSAWLIPSIGCLLWSTPEIHSEGNCESAWSWSSHIAFRCVHIIVGFIVGQDCQWPPAPPSTACGAPSRTMHDSQQRRNFLMSTD